MKNPIRRGLWFAALLWGAGALAGCGGGERKAVSSDSSAAEAAPPPPAVSAEDLERLSREFLEMRRLRERVEAQAETVAREAEALRGLNRELATREAIVGGLVNALRGQGPTSTASADPAQLALTYGPFILATLALFTLWKMRRSRLREDRRRLRRARRRQEAAATAVEEAAAEEDWGSDADDD